METIINCPNCKNEIEKNFLCKIVNKDKEIICCKKCFHRMNDFERRQEKTLRKYRIITALICILLYFFIHLICYFSAVANQSSSYYTLSVFFFFIVYELLSRRVLPGMAEKSAYNKYTYYRYVDDKFVKCLMHVLEH